MTEQSYRCSRGWNQRQSLIRAESAATKSPSSLRIGLLLLLVSKKAECGLSFHVFSPRLCCCCAFRKRNFKNLFMCWFWKFVLELHVSQICSYGNKLQHLCKTRGFNAWASGSNFPSYSRCGMQDARFELSLCKLVWLADLFLQFSINLLIRTCGFISSIVALATLSDSSKVSARVIIYFRAHALIFTDMLYSVTSSSTPHIRPNVITVSMPMLLVRLLIRHFLIQQLSMIFFLIVLFVACEKCMSASKGYWFNGAHRASFTTMCFKANWRSYSTC